MAHDLKDWTYQVDDRYIYGKPDVNTPSLMDEMLVLGSLYFPELKANIHEVALAAKQYKSVALSLGTERVKANGIAAADEIERINQAFSPLVDSISELTRKAEIVAGKLL